MKRPVSGFTLIELLIVIVVMGILATIAIPNYRRTMEVGKVRAAYSHVIAIQNAQQSRMMDMDDYADNMDELRTEGYMSQPAADPDWTYATTDAGLVTATRSAGGGAWAGNILQVDGNGNLTAATDHPLANFTDVF